MCKGALIKKYVLLKVGNRTLTATVLLSAAMVASVIWFYPIIESEAGVPVPTEVIDIDPLNPGDFEFVIESIDSFKPGITGTVHEIDLAPGPGPDNKNKVSFHFRDQTSRSRPDNNVFAHDAVFIIGTSFIAPHTGQYEIAFRDHIVIDSSESFVSMNFLKRPRAADNYVAAFAKFSYDVVANDLDDDTIQNYFTTQNKRDTKDLEFLISAANLNAKAGDPPPVTTFATEQPDRADLIKFGGAAAGRALISVLGFAVNCGVCGTALGAVAESFIADEIGKLLNEESNIFSDAVNLGSDDDDGDRILVRKFFGADFTDVTTFEMDLEKDELVVLSSRLVVGINQIDSSSRHRHAAGISGEYELEKIQIRIFESTPPVITLEGDNPLIHEAGDTLVEPGATVTDNVDGDLTATLVVDSSGVDTNTVGTYLITYNASPDAQGNVPLEVTRTVEVVDNTPPVITLNGADPAEFLVGTSYVEAGASVTDNTDEDLSAALVIDSSAVDTSIVGSYLVTYDASDSSGNAAIQVTRTVNIISQIITFDFMGDLNLSPGDRVIIEGGNIEGNVKVDGGILIIREGATIFGNVEAENGAIVSIEGSTVFGNVVMKDSECLTISASTITGDVEMQNGECVTITGSTINGGVVTKNVQEVTITDNPVIGAIDSENDVKVFIENNNAHLIAT